MAIGIQRSQLDFILTAPILGIGLTVTGLSVNASASIATLLATAGRGAVSVPVQVSTSESVIGLITTGINRVTLRNSNNKDQIRQGTEEVYGKLTQAASVYTITFFYNNNGTETAYSFAASTPVDFAVSYRFDAARLPTDALIAVSGTLLSTDVVGAGGTPPLLFTEPLTIATLNTLPALSKTPFNANFVHLVVNGATYFSTTPSPVFSVSVKALTWIPANGFPLLVGSDCVAVYSTIE